MPDYGRNIQNMVDHCLTIADREEAVRHAIMTAQPGDMILLAGKGHETYQVLKDETIHLDEREIVADAIKNLK